ncbi:helix-turn-helix transcriptional regulator [Enorma sp.]|uniref:helix-turn-helix transcriptional regulator n=1 Tax=Enorma sp. TaxID=1920692 RepID=UPI0025BD129B|nr:helix-turn-helix transcriptional regulator [Enorma sp.]
MAFTGIDEAIAAYLRRSGKTQAELAEELGMSENTLSWKRRRKREFKLSEVIRIAEVTGCSLDEMVPKEEG